MWRNLRKLGPPDRFSHSLQVISADINRLYRPRTSAGSPGRIQFENLLVDRTIFLMSIRQIARAQQKFPHNLPAGEDECFLEKLFPVIQYRGVGCIQPTCE